MKKYLLVAVNTWSEVFTYRLNLIMWRVRTVLQTITLYFIWFAILDGSGSIFGYSQSLMLTYILGSLVVEAFVISSRSNEIGEEINNGNLSNFLIKPINFSLFYFAKDFGDKAMNICFSIFELGLLSFFLLPPLFIQTDPIIWTFVLFSIVIGVIIYFLFNLLLGAVGFWSPDVWATRFIFNIALMFFAGGFFPLDILPKPVFNFLSLTPFPYTLFFPLKIYLGQLTTLEIVRGIMIGGVWIGILYMFVIIVWKKGLKDYTAYGR